jgi:hypothetical protein
MAREWREAQPVFLDETGAKTNEASVNGRSPRGPRLIGTTPRLPGQPKKPLAKRSGFDSTPRLSSTANRGEN